MVEHPTASWEAMQDGKVFYKRQQLYSIANKLPDLGNFIIAGCRGGGPIALMRDTSKLVAVARGTQAFTKSQVQVYSPAGEGLLLFSWDQGKIVKFGWTKDERLVLLNEEGTYRLYDLQGDYEQYSLGVEAGDLGIVDAKIYETGLVALTGSLSFLEIKGWEGARPTTLSNSGLTEPPHSWAVIPPEQTTSQHVEVLLSVEATVFTLDSLENIDQRVSRGPFTHVSPSPNGKSLALLTTSGLLWVVSIDFQRSLAEYDTTQTASDEKAQQVEWCGNDAILITWPNTTALIGPFGDTLQFFYIGSVFAITEVDGVRIISMDSSDLIMKVPPSNVSIFRPGSSSPAATLFDAWENFNEKSPKADEKIRSIKPDLAAAVDECIDAAGHEWEPYWQRRLLNAARFGRGFLDLHNVNDFISMGQTLKVLNAVRHHEVGIPLSYAQYTYASPIHLISRLTSRHLHLLALRISTYMSMSPDTVLRHWACAKIAHSKPSTDGLDGEDGVCKSIVDKFEALGNGKVSYAEIAKKAWEVGRTSLATKLLDYESRPSDQVPLLLSMKEDRLALEKAVDCGDTDLVYHVLLHLHQRLSLGDFFRLIEEGGSRLLPARNLLEVYAREQNKEMLRDFYYSDDRRVDSAILSLREAAQMKDPNAKVTAIKAAQKFFAEDKDSTFEAKIMDESSRLLALQQTFEKDTEGNVAFFGLSVNDTIRTCLLNGLPKKAERVKSDFKVPDKRFWFIKLYALTAIKDWDALEAFAKSKRSPIGYKPFVTHLVSKGYKKEASTFVPRCDSSSRADLYVLCGEWVLAGKECSERGDKAKLEQLRKSAPNSMIERELATIAAGTK